MDWVDGRVVLLNVSLCTLQCARSLLREREKGETCAGARALLELSAS